MPTSEIEQLLESRPVVVPSDDRARRLGHANHRLIEEIELVLVLFGARDKIRAALTSCIDYQLTIARSQLQTLELLRFYQF